MILRDKTIILISSEPWGNIYISKHNYAIALAKRGNRVFFLNPIDATMRPGEFRLEDSAVHPDLRIITYRPWFPLLLKFHLRPIFETLIKRTVRKILRKWKIRPDIVWDFNCSYLYNDLSAFNAPLKIFNPVDFLATDARNKKADLVISISDLILDQYTVENVPKLRLNHGLGEPFALLAFHQAAEGTDQAADVPHRAVTAPNKTIQVGYVGNLTLDSIDRDILLAIIKANTGIIFHFVGPASEKDNNLGTRGSTDQAGYFLRSLQEQKNVVLHGAKPQEEIPALLRRFDILLLCYRRTATFRCDNSHKMVEYLSSGKVVVSTWLSAYEGSGLVEMSAPDDNGQLPGLFRTVAQNLEHFNSSALQEKRRAFALANTYENQLSRIEEFIEKMKG